MHPGAERSIDVTHEAVFKDSPARPVAHGQGAAKAVEGILLIGHRQVGPLAQIRVLRQQESVVEGTGDLAPQEDVVVAHHVG